MLSNLVGAAIKFTPAGGRIALRVASVEQDHALVGVTDTDPGLTQSR